MKQDDRVCTQTETENALARADQLDAEYRAATALAEKTEENVSVRSFKKCKKIKKKFYFKSLKNEL